MHNNMTREQFNDAMDIIARHHTTTVSINLSKDHFVDKIGTAEFRLHITDCVPSVINKLVAAGFMLDMTPDGLCVDKI